MIRAAVSGLAVLILGFVLVACANNDNGGGGGGGSETATPTLSSSSGEPSATSSPATTDAFVIYRDAAGDLVARDLATNDEYRQTVDFQNEVIVGASCAPDGSRIAYLRQAFSEIEREVEIRGENPPAEPIFISSTVQGIGWSPDATRLAITDYDGFGQSYSIGILDIATGELTEIASGSDFVGSIAWSPKGDELAYYLQRVRDGNAQVQVISVDGGEPRVLTDGDVQLYDPDWSADGSTILAAGLAGEEFQLYAINAATGDLTQLTDSDIYKRSAKYSPDGAVIGYTGSIVSEQPLVSARPPLRSLHSFGIFLLDADGANERALTADPRLNPGAAVDPFLDAFMLGWCRPGPWLDELWVPQEVPPTQ